MAELLVPDGDIAAGGWTTQAGGTTNLFQGIDETGTVNLADYVQSALSPVNDIYEFTFSNPSAILTSGVINLQIGKKNNNSVVVNLKFQLLQGTTLIREQTFSDIPFTPALQQVTLTAPEIAAITDATLLRGKLIANPPSGVTLAFGSGATSYGANLTTNTFTAMSFPNPAAGRICVVDISLLSAFTIDTVTIGGVAATQRAGSSTAENLETSIWTAPVAAGATLDVVVTMSGASASTDIIIAAYSITGAASAVPAATTVTEYANTHPRVATVVVPTGGVAICMVSYASGARNSVWSVGVEDYDPTPGASLGASSGHATDTGSQALGASAAGGTPFGVAVSAAWGP